MEATVLICDYAQVHAGKLYVVGAGANLVGTLSNTPPYPISLAAAVMITIPWNAHNHLHRLKISVVSEDGQPVEFATPQPGQEVPEEDRGSLIAQFNAGRSPLMQPGESSLMPLAIPLNVPVPALGGYTVSVDIDGSAVASAKFRVTTVQSPTPPPVVM
jgi:hypothetical protein